MADQTRAGEIVGGKRLEMSWWEDLPGRVGRKRRMVDSELQPVVGQQERRLDSKGLEGVD